MRVTPATLIKKAKGSWLNCFHVSKIYSSLHYIHLRCKQWKIDTKIYSAIRLTQLQQDLPSPLWLC